MGFGGFSRRPIAKARNGHLVRETYANGIKNSWWDISAKVRARDSNRCVYCGAPAEEIHHLVPLSKGGTTTMSNLVCVCRACHNRLHTHLKNRGLR